VNNVTPLRGDIAPKATAIEAEQGLLGALIIDNRLFWSARKIISANDFSDPFYSRVFATIEGILQRGDEADPIAIKLIIENTAGVAMPEIAGTLASLVAGTVSLRNTAFYAKEIANCAFRRELVQLGQFGETLRDDEIRDRLADLLAARQVDALRAINPADLQDEPVPDRCWIVPNWIPDGYVTGIAGSGGIGKSLIAQQLVTACATGAPWLGLPTTLCRCIYFACEDAPDELHRRQENINRFYKTDFRDLANIRWLPRLGQNNLLMTFEHGIPALTATFAELLREAKTFGAKVVVVDTVADTFGGNENHRGEVRQFVQACLGRLGLEIEGAVVALVHPSRSGQADGTGQSGSTGWDAAFRSRLYQTTPMTEGGACLDPELRELARLKANYAGRDDRITLRWVDGVFVAEQLPGGIDAAARRAHAERVFLDLLDKTFARNEWVSPSAHASNYAPRVFTTTLNAEGCAIADLTTAMLSLLRSERIATEAYGPASKDRRRIVRGGASE
jgi:RecA-family ATPase